MRTTDTETGAGTGADPKAADPKADAAAPDNAADSASPDSAPADAASDEARLTREAESQLSSLSTAPGEERLNVPSIGLVGWLRWFWRQLTSMRVALILLFLLSLAAIPGSVVPQKAVDSVKVEEFQKKHDVLSPVYEKLQLFDVYTSVWFSAIYILLFVSLAGCIVPRTWQFVGQLRSRPPRAPRRLERMPAYTTWRTETDPDEVLGRAGRLLGRRRFRVDREGDAVASEKGYLREAGNLLFHIALIVLLLAFAAGQLWKSDGGKLIIKGDGFSNTLTQYDDFKSGSLFDPDDLDSFGFSLRDFHASYEESGPQKGTARDFRAGVSYWQGPGGKEKQGSIEVNHPLEVGDSKVFLNGNGYAPVISVKDGKGRTAYRGPVAFLPQDGNLTSSGVLKVTDYRDAKGRKDQLGFQGFFVPTFGGSGAGTMFSQSPSLKYPVLFLTAYHGDLGLDYGAAQSVYQLDTKRMKQFKKDDGSPLAKKILPGETMELPDGGGELKFEGVRQWAQFQIVHQVGEGWALGGALAAIGGLAGSLFIQRRRVWVRAVAGPDGLTVVEMAGLGRSESARLPEELGDLAYALQDGAPPAEDADQQDAHQDDADRPPPADAADADSKADAADADAKADAADADAHSDAHADEPADNDEESAETSPRGERQ
ncbi:cytochrome c biogenesis protein ResB [Streptomyces marispadix]|uniref:Cytochrome c biogenesis protein ResB n=1 Tax=Streptomyces marispadix TaxID=2922868 RepID=A0ABS9T047_9ACTN|nr:cytochrome c biogenesis protein ResB [Streptomyces marispadix]MCH6161910.1 cytochrome c biogenesis protein ResB [Streptomyces marispadix]